MTQVCSAQTMLLLQGTALTPREMAQRESLVAPPVAALLRRLAGRSAPHIVLGAPLQQAVCCFLLSCSLQTSFHSLISVEECSALHANQRKLRGSCTVCSSDQTSASNDCAAVPCRWASALPGSGKHARRQPTHGT